ncbi:MAG: flagellar basal body rod protein FlgB [Limnochordaceae bacterium]|uniref:Flagellar basal body rod protein FlgB n=1 Tax=Carboxydichorda subterranea TaxID=3109565 RepID=A0ABZ1C0B3_9FIRM|nr:flagellar basal body rod protein FlgB [Limnochorda sp. L945t]MBE3598030.1 flagellar basal body rod protein FlgB [Limnochordaceae bacterium]WRP18443.1 flagellar basal body rod protein FlgB [Limnochorda sp. L945t]
MEGTGFLWGPVERDLSNALDAASLRQRVIAHNLANVETPRYRRFDVVFEEALAAQQAREARIKVKLTRTHPAHLSGAPVQVVTPSVERDTTSIVRNDRSNVDVDREMAALAKNSLFYRSLTRVMGSRLMALRTAITEGRR